MTNNSVITHSTAYDQQNLNLNQFNEQYEPIPANLTPRQDKHRFDMYDNNIRDRNDRNHIKDNTMRMSRSFNDINMDRNTNMGITDRSEMS